MRTLIATAVLAVTAVWCAPASSADEQLDAMERDAKAAGVTMDFQTGAIMGALCTARGMSFVEMPDTDVIADLASHGRSRSEATSIWNVVKKNCTKS